MEKIYFANSNGKRLCGNISNAKSKLAILICHGLGSSKDDYKYKVLQRKLLKYDVPSFAIDLLGHGESEGTYNDLTLSEAIDDILCAKHELERRGYSKIGFIGVSFGGVGGIMAASKEQFKFLNLISPPTYYNVKEILKSSIYVLKELRSSNKKNIQKKKTRIKIKFFKDYGSHDSYKAAEKIVAPVLIIQGDKDKIVPVKRSKELQQKIKGSKIKIFKGTNHHYTNMKNKLIQEIMKFVKSQIKV